ncbi:helix-turn-helix domain-containing protein [Chelativorans alearense]|uniref:helix-turn-helix domain-containing protein n=1 Tax=Chelativorans alearense TaxID=2681495 RepID=UPI0013D79909|nr:helix-turn-helix transcriptional regulator [Chelativorans alearense]
MDSDALVQLALAAQSCSQKDLAALLKVSPTQISKWKKGEHISLDMSDRLRALAKIGDLDPSFVLWSGSTEKARKWNSLLHFLAQLISENAETGYDTAPLADDDLGLLGWQTFHTLREMGVAIPQDFPKELEFDYNVRFFEKDEDDEKRIEALEEHTFTSLIRAIYHALNDVYGFYAAYVDELIMDEDLDLFDSPAGNIEPCLMDLAATKIEVDPAFAPKFNEFRHRTRKEYRSWLNLVKHKAIRAGAPLRAELLDLVYFPHEDLGRMAELESLGRNSVRLHPDIYMNELLCGMRAIHKIMPIILEKLGVSEEISIDSAVFTVERVD